MRACYSDDAASSSYDAFDVPGSAAQPPPSPAPLRLHCPRLAHTVPRLHRRCLIFTEVFPDPRRFVDQKTSAHSWRRLQKKQQADVTMMEEAQVLPARIWMLRVFLEYSAPRNDHSDPGSD
ncbi:hypothetical protein WMY93_029864 [Mugilogobius chulae]|uniref:Uncharacterized protein n=1 Tax=Mugilogobius chulae TaxID=88201 RepID=A0AAW0MN00_9GOBI